MRKNGQIKRCRRVHLEPSHKRPHLADAGEEPVFCRHRTEVKVGSTHIEHQKQMDLQPVQPEATLHQPASTPANPVLPKRRAFVVAWEKKDHREWRKSDSQFGGRALVRYVHCSYHDGRYVQVQKSLPDALSDESKRVAFDWLDICSTLTIRTMQGQLPI